MKTYSGVRAEPQGAVAFVEQPGGRPKALDPRFDLRNHSPDGFEWGYGGSGPSQLALALCADVLGDDERAQRVYHDFKFAVISGIDADRWQLTERQILDAIEMIEDVGVNEVVHRRREAKARSLLGHEDRCEHGMFRSGAGACPKCGQ